MNTHTGPQAPRTPRSRRWAYALPLVSAMALVGCAAQRPPVPAEVSAPAPAWLAPVLPHQGDAQALADWWAGWQDPTLVAWIAKAQSLSPTLADARAQVAAKQRVLEDNLARIGNVRPEVILPPIHGPAWGYRSRARLSVRHVVRKGGVLVGFHEKRSSYVSDMRECPVLPARISNLLVPLRELVQGLSIRDRLPQIEVACGEDVDVLVLRILDPLSESDEVALRDFADVHGVWLWLQTGGPATARPFHPPQPPALDYALPEFGLRVPFGPTEFTQVNQAVNRMLVRRAIGLLDPQPGSRIADMFCGLGNFTLPIARRGASVLGMEGSEALVARAADNAARAGLSGRASFAVCNLFEIGAPDLAALGPFDGMLIDPPRDGALALVKALEGGPPKRIVYVSCNPATLARDAAVLVQVMGYRLRAAGVANMFPHTSHVESVACFER